VLRLSNLDFDIGTIDADIVAVNIASGRRTEDLATGYIKDGAVPWTGDFGAGNLTFTKRTAYVRTTIVDGVESAVDIKERDLVSVYFDQLCLTRRNFAGPGDLHKL
jgi:hypothetical protein